jgi:hypothetical protein
VAAFIINEWLWADSAGDNGADRQKDAFSVMTKLSVSDHQIVVVVGSAFDQKAWKFCKSDNAVVVGIAKIYVNALRLNSSRCLLVKSEAIEPLPAGLAASVKPDDHYLVQAQLSVNGAILVTTDKPLRDAAAAAGLTCLSRDEFLQTYF